jgi:exodeoxyribonuclease VII small subunit
VTSVQSEPKTFEEILKALELEVERLEGGELPLEDALAAFERGMQLVTLGQGKLENAEATVERLLAAREGIAETQPLDADG